MAANNKTKEAGHVPPEAAQPNSSRQVRAVIPSSPAIEKFMRRHAAGIPLKDINEFEIREEVYSSSYEGGNGNKAASLSIASISEDPLKREESYANYIQEHYLRRVDIFFYILIAYYRTNMHPELANPTLRHGQGKKSSLTEGAHSNFFAQLRDESIQNDELYKATVRCKAYNKQSILCGTHFMDTMNMTTEVLRFINDLDQELEGQTIATPSHCKKEALAILQRVARGEMNPIQGLTAFLSEMESTFNRLKNKQPINTHGTTTPYLDRDTPYSPQHVKPKLLALAERGTLEKSWCPRTQQVRDEYVQSLLNLTEGCDFYMMTVEEYNNSLSRITTFRNTCILVKNESSNSFHLLHMRADGSHNFLNITNVEKFEALRLQIMGDRVYKRLNDDQVHHLLTLNSDYRPTENQLQKARANNPGKTKEQIYEERMLELQWEILNTPSDHAVVLNKPGQEPSFYSAPYVKRSSDYSEFTTEGYYTLGVVFYQKKSFTEAVKYFQIAAINGHSNAQVCLGHCYENGIGAEKHYEYAIRYYNAAAQQDNRSAYYNLGRCWEEVEKNIPNAIHYYKLAAAQDYPLAREALTRLTSQVVLSDDATRPEPPGLPLPEESNPNLETPAQPPVKATISPSSAMLLASTGMGIGLSGTAQASGIAPPLPSAPSTAATVP